LTRILGNWMSTFRMLVASAWSSATLKSGIIQIRFTRHALHQVQTRHGKRRCTCLRSQ
jgi:hypothetical protein